jgi:hypothetical protein
VAPTNAPAPAPVATPAATSSINAAAAPGDAAVPLADAASPDASATGGDAGISALTPAAQAAAVWPDWIESKVVESERTVGEFDFDLSYPQFQTRPPDIAKELNARFATLIDPGLDPSKYQGRFELHCTPRVVNRLVAIVECSRMLDSRTLAEARAGTGGAPGGPTPKVFAVWLQPGLPAISLDELAPNVDVNAALAAIPASCAGQCAFARDSFVVDEEGAVRFVPTDYCSAECGKEQAPVIALDARKSKHLWVVKLDDWIRKRLVAGESLVK